MSDRWKEYWQKLQSTNKQIWIMMALIMVGLTLVIYNPEDKNRENVSIPQTTALNSQVQQENRGMAREEKELARTLETMLSQIHGVGDVKVSVRLATSTNSNYAFNTEGGEKVTEEKDQSGGTRTTTETSEREQLVLVQGSQGNEIPVVEKEIAPQIAGVMVVARGASNPEVKARLFQAVQVSLGVDPHKVIVLPMERGEG